MSNSKQPLDLTATKNTPTMSNNNSKQPLETERLPESDEAQAPSTTTTVKKLNYVGINLVGRRFRDVRPGEKNDSIHIPEIKKHDVTTPNLSHYSDEASPSTPINGRIENVNQTIGILLKCAERGENRGKQPSPSICKVSRILRDHSESSFTPQLVSIGPIHGEDPKLQELEGLKECYLNHLLNRFDSDPKKTLEACLLKVNTLIPKIRESYAGVENYTGSELARMMVMDGCFILEFCFKNGEEDLYLRNKMVSSRIAMDLMLLENQVPFFVLQALFDCFIRNESFTLSVVLDYCLAPYIMLFHSLLPEEITYVDSDSTQDHLLGYLHKRCQLVVAKSKRVDVERKENRLTAFHSIVDLDRSGMNFKPHQSWSMTVKFQPSLFPCLPRFWSTPTLLMPALVIDDSTELILRNFIAYEQLFRKHRDCFTQYAVAMDILIDTQEDIAKLVESKVLVNRLGSNQEAADMINKICKNRFVTDPCYIKAFKQMDKYHNGFWPKNIARLRRVYFSNPWSIIALVAAIILFSLTVVQTIYTVVQTVYTIRAA